MAIGTAWADGAWIDAGWVTGAWSQAIGPSTPEQAQINDAIVNAVGLDGIEQCLASHFSKTASESLQDAERRWLIAQGATPGHLADMWVELFGPGDIVKVMLDYWNSQRP